MYDIIIIGSGPGGYLAAERAGARGKKVLIIEKEHLGGVCLNRGCIPTKSLLNSSKLYKKALHSEQFGVHAENVSFNMEEAMAWKQEVVMHNRNGVAFLMKHNKVDVIEGEAFFKGGRKVQVDGKEYEGETIILATGSRPFILPIPGADSPHVKTSREVLELKELPEKVAVIGGGVIGLEFASFFSNLGIQTDIIEMMDEIVPFMDRDLAKVMRREMKAVNFNLSCKVEKIDGKKVFYTDKKGKENSIEADLILMSVGRRPNIENFEGAGLDIERGRIKVDDKMRTNLPGVYAIGDVTGKSLLAHSAYRMGEVAVNNICGGDDHMRYKAVPWAVYSHPEAAGVGMTESEAKEKGFNVKAASMQMRGNGRFFAENGKASGVCKVVVDADSDVILGVHMLGGMCSEIIAAGSTMIEAELRVSEVKEIIFPHPSVSEIIKDTLWAL
ncbi:dihydrolipoyl dehydrogenase [Spirochaeta isovalerica]|uniref:Dihydrolipoyl dehydrogenase n=1 Tax=Spirochaeta isovalerica TaxID=150 RepID=A0A841R9V7_9SPIO|nr:dihydrolipoyl dehydrogenase [Spirochaeta isovalerica]MBB6480673.1 dihydrolipoamide dehydrogenase [Spirochaeta isovalerica]